MSTELLTPKEFAKEYRVTEQCVTRLCRTNQLKAYRIGGQWRIPYNKEEVEHYAEQNKRTA